MGCLMRWIYIILFFSLGWSLSAEENIIHDDGTGAQISFCLPKQGKVENRAVDYHTFRVSVVREGKFLLFADLAGKTSEDGKFFRGQIIIPSDFINSARILCLGNFSNSTLSTTKELRVNNFERIRQAKSWTDKP
jgi:hypothetical protein